jgi:hypothetical protein
MSPLFPYHGDTGAPVKIVFAILAPVVDEKILFFIDQLEDITSACLKIGGELNGQSRTRLLAESSVDAPGKVDPEPPGVTSAVFPLRRLHGDAADRADRGAEITGNAALLAIRVPCQNDHSPGTGGQRPLILRILFGDWLSKKDFKGCCKTLGQCLYPFHDTSLMLYSCAPSPRPPPLGERERVRGVILRA